MFVRKRGVGGKVSWRCGRGARQNGNISGDRRLLPFKTHLRGEVFTNEEPPSTILFLRTLRYKDKTRALVGLRTTSLSLQLSKSHNIFNGTCRPTRNSRTSSTADLVSTNEPCLGRPNTIRLPCLWRSNDEQVCRYLGKHPAKGVKWKGEIWVQFWVRPLKAQ